MKLPPLDNDGLRDSLVKRGGWRRAKTAGLCSRCGGTYDRGVAILNEAGLGPRAQCCADTSASRPAPKTHQRSKPDGGT